MKTVSCKELTVFLFIFGSIEFLLCEVMNRIYFSLLVFFLLNLNIQAQAYRTRPISSDISTIKVNANGEWNGKSIIELNSNNYIKISFDRLSDDSYNRLRYKITHCDAGWIPSTQISEIDYLDGFNDNLIEDYSPSINTTMEYTHFNLEIPNNDVKIKLSGNYLIQVYDENDPEQILLDACFSVLDPQLSVRATVSSITDIDANKQHQQLSFNLDYKFNLRDPNNDLKVFVRQNNRLDTERRIQNPSFITSGRVGYEHIRDLIFEAGNEYRRFEVSSLRNSGFNVANIEYQPPYYHVQILPDKVRSGRSYSYDQDQNGRFIVRNRDINDAKSDVEADYFYATFTLEMDKPLLQKIYLNGYFTYNTFSDIYEMKYDPFSSSYSATILLKQGQYNYLYLTKMDSFFSTAPVEGNYYETENEYSILVYYRPQGQRYDAMIGEYTIQSRSK